MKNQIERLGALQRRLRLACVLVWMVAAVLFAPSRASADTCASSVITCKKSDGTATKCATRQPGTICIDKDGDVSQGIDGTCEFPCTQTSDCSIGEACISGRSNSASATYC